MDPLEMAGLEEAQLLVRIQLREGMEGRKRALYLPAVSGGPRLSEALTSTEALGMVGVPHRQTEARELHPYLVVLDQTQRLLCLLQTILDPGELESPLEVVEEVPVVMVRFK